ncbi:A24 family peptidase [Streptomyces sp. NPDC005303]|uniref:A24 family peptidase n=1 Tax=Streptomyces sp. NPDC005303 TaxID=3155713 RepID=UPI0033A3D0D9
MSAIVGLAGAALLPGVGGSWRTALLGSLTLGACCFVLFLINARGFGFGDVKLAPALGADLGWCGWGILLIGTFAGFLFECRVRQRPHPHAAGRTQIGDPVRAVPPGWRVRRDPLRFPHPVTFAGRVGSPSSRRRVGGAPVRRARGRRAQSAGEGHR